MYRIKLHYVTVGMKPKMLRRLVLLVPMAHVALWRGFTAIMKMLEIS